MYPIDVQKIKEDFPIFKRTIHGKRFVYLDSAATTQRPQSVIDAISEFYSGHNANTRRSVYTIGEEATEAHEGARKKVAGFIGASPEETVFVRGTTEGINLVRFAWGEKFVKPGDLLVTTLMEHHSVIVPLLLLAKKTGARLKFVGLNGDGTLDMDGFEQMMKEAPALVAFTQASNVLGTINDAKAICRKAHDAGAVHQGDGAGIGALYGKKKMLDEMDPFHGGGEMIKEVHTTGFTWDDPPYKFEAGTVSVADSIGFGAAVDYLGSIGMERVRAHDLELTKYAMDVLKGEGAAIYGPANPERRGGVVSFNVDGIHPHDMATILDEEGIAIRSGHHCAQPLMEWLGVPATNRASFYIYNSHDDIVALRSGIEKAKRMLG